MNKKILGLVLAAAMVTGVGGFGTMAALTSGDTVDETVNITLGSVTVDARWTEGEWAVNSVGNEAELQATDDGWGLSIKDLKAVNVKPGDTFTRNFMVANTGSLRSNMSLAVVDAIQGADITIELVNNNGADNVECQSKNSTITNIGARGVFIEYKMTVTVQDNFEVFTEKLVDLINVSATQLQ